MATPSYVIRGGLEGRERLRVLARVMWPTTSALFDRVGIAPTRGVSTWGAVGATSRLRSPRVSPTVKSSESTSMRPRWSSATTEAASAGVDNVTFRVEDVTTAPEPDDRST